MQANESNLPVPTEPTQSAVPAEATEAVEAAKPAVPVEPNAADAPNKVSESLATIQAAIQTPDQPSTVTLPTATFQQITDLWSQHLKEQKWARRWKYAFRFLIVGLITLLIVWPFMRGSSGNAATQAHVALIKLEGAIEYGSPAGAEPMIASLHAAFEDSASVAIVLQMNSPGGSPVQAHMIYEEINRLRDKFDKPVYAVLEEVCASGCYYVAAAADDIYVQPSSLVGSIGVIMDGFGATELMKKLGVERRMYTAGSNKGMLDPFSPANDKQTKIVNEMLKDVHEQFITAVKNGRGDTLSSDTDIFSGRIYTGNQSLALGLADEIGSTSTVAREVVGVDNWVDYSPKENIAERVAKKLGASFGAGALHSLLQLSSTQSVK